MATDPKSMDPWPQFLGRQPITWFGSPQDRRQIRKQVNRICRHRQSPTSSSRSCLVTSAIPTCGSPTARPIWSAPRPYVPTARFEASAWPRHCNAKSPGECGVGKSSTAAASSTVNGRVDVRAKTRSLHNSELHVEIDVSASAPEFFCTSVDLGAFADALRRGPCRVRRSPESAPPTAP
jgi:hypothetical protein